MTLNLKCALAWLCWIVWMMFIEIPKRLDAMDYFIGINPDPDEIILFNFYWFIIPIIVSGFLTILAVLTDKGLSK